MHQRLKWISEENRSNANECTTSNVLKDKQERRFTNVFYMTELISLGGDQDQITFVSKIDLRM